MFDKAVDVWYKFLGGLSETERLGEAQIQEVTSGGWSKAQGSR
jgi:hypothetical protein